MSEGRTELRSPGSSRPPDLRLAGFAVATWLAALACLYLSSRAGLLPGGSPRLPPAARPAAL
jgi:hypothetical protein